MCGSHFCVALSFNVQMRVLSANIQRKLIASTKEIYGRNIKQTASANQNGGTIFRMS